MAEPEALGAVTVVSARMGDVARALIPLDDAAQAAVLGLLDAARERAGLPSRAQWAEEAEAAAYRPRTGHKMARATGLAGRTAAHALRLAVDPGAAAPWDVALRACGEAIGSWDWDLRMRAALDLRDTFRHLSPPPDGSRPARLVAAWLTHADDAGLVAATVKLADFTAVDHEARAVLGRAWWAANGLAALRVLTERGQTVRGNPTREQADHRAQLRAVVQGLSTAGVLGPAQLAKAAHISRNTLSAWTAAAP